MQIVSYEGNLHDMSNPIFWDKYEKKKNYKLLHADC